MKIESNKLCAFCSMDFLRLPDLYVVIFVKAILLLPLDCTLSSKTASDFC